MSEPRRSLLSALVGDDEVEALLSDTAQLHGLLAFERALAEAEAASGLISESAATAIAATIDRFQPDWDDLARGLAQDGVVVPALIRQLRDAIGEPHGSAVHHGATSQDAIDTALVLQLARIIPVYLDRIAMLRAALGTLNDKSGRVPLMAHTRMQAALSFTGAEKIKTWVEPLGRHREALAGIRRQLLVVQLGGPVGDRSSFGGRGDAVARGLAKTLDLGVAEPWHSTRDPIVAFGSLLSLLTGSLGKFGADVALLAQTEVAAIELADGGGSSAMAHKSNPVNAELLVALARYNAGLVGSLHQALVHENERSGSAWTLEWMTLPAMLVATAAALRLAIKLAGQIKFRP
ncbi:MAG: 3-carboxy-cis,cis-muconate cycloisomerase [Cucumibacter sp.]